MEKNPGGGGGEGGKGSQKIGMGGQGVSKDGIRGVPHCLGGTEGERGKNWGRGY